MEARPQFLCVGLGNPGAKYAQNRHNVGFQVLDALAQHFGASALPSEDAQTDAKPFVLQKVDVQIQQAPARLFFMKPLMYMNVSGPPVAKIANFYKIDPSHVFVLHDELALPLGKLKVKWGGGHAGHNGLKSLDAHLGKAYARLRIGIDHPGSAEEVTGYVLSNFQKAEQKIVGLVTQSIVRHFDKLLLSALKGITSDSAGPFMTAVTEDLKAC